MSKRLINFKVIARVIGSLLLTSGIMMSTTIPVAAYFGEGDLYPLIFSTVITLVVGLVLFIANRDSRNAEIQKREGYLIVTLGWICLALFGTLPYLLSGSIPNFTDAFFESMAGFTTTGSSILNDIESVPRGVLFWRSMSQWIGGLGIIVLTIAVLPLLGIGGMELFTAEAPGPTKDKIHPRIKETAKRLWGIYLVLTVGEIIMLLIAGMDFYDAVNHALTTCSTGGFSTKSGSIAAFDSFWIELIIVVFMFLSGTNFTLLYFGAKGQLGRIFANSEFRWYGSVIIFATVLVTTALIVAKDYSFPEALRDAVFQVTSIVTTTGYASADYLAWGGFAGTIFFVLLFSGGSAGSTSGSVKIVRIVLLMKNTFVEFRRRLHPKAVIPVNLNKEAVPPHIIYNLMAFIFVYISVAIIGGIALSAFGIEFMTAASASATALGNVGPGLGDVGPTSNFSALPGGAKWILSGLMLTGRLELFTVLLIFNRHFWRRN